MNQRKLLSSFLFVFLLASCQTSGSTTSSSKDGATSSSTTLPTSSSSSLLPDSSISSIDPSSGAIDASSNYVDNQGDFTITTDVEGGYSVEGKVYTISAAGEYTLQGKLEDGQILVNAPDQKVTLRLEGVTMTSSLNSLIYVEDADKVNIKAIDGTYNELQDLRALKEGDLDEDEGNACIYSKEDLDFGGSGSLQVTSTFNNGIHTKKDLSIKKLTMKVDAINNALKGNNSITIESGNIIAISRGGNGLKTTKSDVSSKGNQKGNITITGGSVDVYASCDAIDAAYDFVMTNENEPSIRLFTDKYSEYSSTVIQSNEKKMYIRVSGTYLDSTYRYAACFYNSDEDYVWKNATYYTVSNENPRKPYYIYSLDKPSSYANVQFYKFLSSQSENSFTTYEAKSEGGTVNSNKDMYAISSVSNQQIEGTWTSYTVSNSSSSSSSSHKADHSAKGIKAQNQISISGGTCVIEANDDGLHANQGTTLDNGEVGVGDIEITGGQFTIASSDDGIHADHIAKFSDAQIEVTKSYEGIEANQLYFYSGTYYVKADDDGINACNGSESILIEVQGGYIDVTVGSGDTDAIDSNGDYRQTGGFVVARCGANDTSGNMAALDIDGTFYMEGGTFIGAGSMGALPSNSAINYVRFGTSGGGNRPGGGGGPGGWWAYGGSSYQVSAGDYQVENTQIQFSLSTTYSGLFIASDQLVLNQTYTLTNGTTSKSWTQSSSSVTVSNS